MSDPAYSMIFHACLFLLELTIVLYLSCTQSAAPMENGQLIVRLSFPTDLKLNFNAEKNLEGAALCIDGMSQPPPNILRYLYFISHSSLSMISK